MSTESDSKAGAPRAQAELEVSVLEDLRALKALAACSNVSNAQVRQSSALVRRLITHDDLRKVANGRIGRLHLQAPDNSAFLRPDPTLAFFIGGGAPAFGIDARANALHRGRSSNSYDPEAIIDLTVDAWERQPVAFIRPLTLPGLPQGGGTWVTRGQVIKYVANVAHGVHAGKAREAYEKILNQIRNALLISSKGGTARLMIDPAKVDRPDETYAHRPAHLDAVFWEFFCGVTFIANSPNVLTLVEALEADYS